MHYFSVVSIYQNETVIAGCLNGNDYDVALFKDRNICQRRSQYTVCGCSKTKRCNSPMAYSKLFEFTDKPILEGYPLIPDINASVPHSGEYLFQFQLLQVLLYVSRYNFFIIWPLIFVIIFLAHFPAAKFKKPIWFGNIVYLKIHFLKGFPSVSLKFPPSKATSSIFYYCVVALSNVPAIVLFFSISSRVSLKAVQKTFFVQFIASRLLYFQPSMKNHV